MAYASRTVQAAAQVKPSKKNAKHIVRCGRARRNAKQRLAYGLWLLLSRQILLSTSPERSAEPIPAKINHPWPYAKHFFKGSGSRCRQQAAVDKRLTKTEKRFAKSLDELTKTIDKFLKRLQTSRKNSPFLKTSQSRPTSETRRVARLEVHQP